MTGYVITAILSFALGFGLAMWAAASRLAHDEKLRRRIIDAVNRNRDAGWTT
jgi:hypothetical protein